MSYPTNRFDFESGTIASMGLDDFGSDCTISTTHVFTGAQSVTNTTTGGHDVYTTTADTLSGNVTLSIYAYVTLQIGVQLMGRVQPFGTDANTVLVAEFSASGITLYNNVSGVSTTLNTPISGATIPTGVWLLIELRCNSTAASARVFRTDTN